MTARRHVLLTFDVDLADYFSGRAVDEFASCFPNIWNVLERCEGVVATWFVRIDQHVGTFFGDARYCLLRHGDKLRQIMTAGHEVAWHHHAYKLSNDEWIQETDEAKVCDQLNIYGAIAKESGMAAARLGWSHQTNATLAALESLGFSRDSTAMPRPRYPWTSGQAWERCGTQPYYPSCDDYQVPGQPQRSILELPISTVPLSMPSDTMRDVVRCINPAYRPDIFRKAVDAFDGEVMVLVSHPYEFFPNPGGATTAIAFAIDALNENIAYLKQRGFVFHTVSGVPL